MSTRYTPLAQAELLAAFGPDWRDGNRPDQDYGQKLIHVDGYAIWFGFDTHRGRYEVSPVWPTYPDGSMCYPSTYDPMHIDRINVSASRGAVAIAKDVQRRFLPGYVAAWRAMMARVEAQRAHEARGLDGLTRIAALVNKPIRTEYNGRPNTSLYLSGDFHPHQVTVHGDSVRFEAFSCPVEVALAILPLLRTTEKGER